MHKLTDLIDSITYVRFGKYEILKGTNNLSKTSGVWEWLNRQEATFGGRNRCINKLAGWHTNTTQDVKSIFMLIKHETHTGGSDLNPQEIVSRTQILDFKFWTQQSNKALNQSGVTTSEQNVIHIDKQITDIMIHF